MPATSAPLLTRMAGEQSGPSNVEIMPLGFPSWPSVARQISLNARNGSGSRLLDNASFASCRSSILGFSALSTMALSTASAPPHSAERRASFG